MGGEQAAIQLLPLHISEPPQSPRRFRIVVHPEQPSKVNHCVPFYLYKLYRFLCRNEAVVELNMKNLAPAFKDPVKRAWFEEVLNNFIKLWEVNL